MKTILFDLDGTIIDPKTGIIDSSSKALVELGHGDKVTENMNWIIGPPLRKSMGQILPSALVEDAVILYREIHSKGGLLEVLLYDGIIDAIKALKNNNYRLFVCTAKNTPFAKRTIEHFELSQYFDEVYGSHLDGTFDDKAELIAHILNAHSICAADTMMIGDREHDMIAACKNGVVGYGALWGYGSVEELNNAGASKLFNTAPDFQVFILHNNLH